MVSALEVIRYGTLISLFSFAAMIYFAYRAQKAALAKLKEFLDRLHRLSALVESLEVEKKMMAAQAKNTVDKHALAAVLEHVAKTLDKSLLVQVARVRTRGG